MLAEVFRWSLLISHLYLNLHFIFIRTLSLWMSSLLKLSVFQFSYVLIFLCHWGSEGSVASFFQKCLGLYCHTTYLRIKKKLIQCLGMPFTKTRHLSLSSSLLSSRNCSLGIWGLICSHRWNKLGRFVWAGGSGWFTGLTRDCENDWDDLRMTWYPADQFCDHLPESLQQLLGFL